MTAVSGGVVLVNDTVGLIAVNHHFIFIVKNSSIHVETEAREVCSFFFLIKPKRGREVDEIKSFRRGFRLLFFHEEEICCCAVFLNGFVCVRMLVCLLVYQGYTFAERQAIDEL